MASSGKVKLNNPALLRWARESAGYTLEQIATHLRKRPGDIAAWESGDGAPTYRQLEAFARKVKRPVAALFLPQVPQEPPLPKDYRILPGSKAGTFTPETRLAFRMLRNALSDLRALLEDLGHPLGFSLPRWTLDSDAISKAMQLRGSFGVAFEAQMEWRNGYEALDTWRAMLFRSGVLVQILDMPLQDARAFSVVEQGIAGIGISNEDARYGRIFSVFHEVGHLCLGQPGVSGELAPTRAAAPSHTKRLETYCDQFAAAFLLPHEHPLVSQAMDELAGDLTRQRAQSYAGKFKVSKHVIARRMLDLGLVDSNTYWDEVRQWREQDRVAAARAPHREGGPEAVTVEVSRAGKPYVAVVLEALDRGVLTAYEAGKMLSLKPLRLQEARVAVAQA